MVGDKRIKKYLFITTGSFPYGNAASNRLLSYARGLSELGENVSILVLSPDYTQAKKSNNHNVDYYGVKIKYSSPLLFVKRGLLGKINFLFGVLCGYLILISEIIKNKKSIAIILLFIEPFLLHIFIITLKLLNLKVYHERTEFPSIANWHEFKYNYYLNRIIPLFDGIYVISYALVDFFSKITQHSILHLPMTVEFDRFENNPIPSKKQYIAYCGSMNTNKDGVPDLIDSFNLIAGRFNNLFLYLIGDNSDIFKFQYIKDKINASPFKDRIICTGQVSRDEIPILLKNASILALSRPNSVQSQGGFPTKLGEYLATGNPVIITDVGDHTRYLQDGISAFIAKPDNPFSFSQKIIECLEDPIKAKSIGLNGLQVALKNFNYLNQAKDLKNFIENIK
jgi:glycosyltransferase involved in cell wall biosynthesis